MKGDKKEKFTHLNQAGNPAMVDVSEKKATNRKAVAQSVVKIDDKILQAFQAEEIKTKKGPVLQTAIIAGTMAAKNTGQLIPLCHPLPLESCEFEIKVEPTRKQITIHCATAIHAKTGVEMEALTGASVAALTIYDMCKALSHNIVISETKLMEKTGGKNDFKRTSETR